MKRPGPIFEDARETFWRTLQTFAFTRTVIVAMLLGYFGWAGSKLVRYQQEFWTTCVVYMALALVFVLLATYARRRFLLQVSAQILVDLAAISLLYISMGGIKSGLAILYLFPLAGGAILAPLVLALFFVSVATLVMLAENGYQLLNASADISSSQAGLYGAAFFIVIITVNRLADRAGIIGARPRQGAICTAGNQSPDHCRYGRWGAGRRSQGTGVDQQSGSCAHAGIDLPA
jgi:two-component system sensor histidine kinase PilS (NtrC family)